MLFIRGRLVKKAKLFLFLFIVITFQTTFSREVFGWLQYSNNSYNLSKASLSKSYIKDGISTISMQYWNVQADGSIPYITGEESSSRVTEWINWAETNNKKAFMTIAAFSSGLAHNWNPQIQGALLNNKDKLIQNVLDTVDHYGFDGVDIDFEAGWRITDGEGKSDLDTFIKNLSDSLKVRDLELSICTFGGREWNFPNLSDIIRWQGYIDYVNIMGYGETSEYAANSDLTYSSIIDYCVNTQGYDSSAVNLGLPAWAQNWHGYDLDVHVDDINRIHGGVCIWDLKLNGGALWQSSNTWTVLKEIREYGEPIVATSSNLNFTPGNIYHSKIKTNKSIPINIDLKAAYSVAKIFNLQGKLLKEVSIKDITSINFKKLGLTDGTKIIKFK